MCGIKDLYIEGFHIWVVWTSCQRCEVVSSPSARRGEACSCSLNDHLFQQQPQEAPEEIQGGPGTEPEPETGTAGTVFPGTERGTGTVFQEPKPEPEPSSLLNCTETQKNPSLEEPGTENRNHSNRSIPKP